MYANTEGRVPVQIWITPEARQAVKLAARRAGLTMEQAGREAVAGWLEYAARCELVEAKLIAQENAEAGVMISA